jgi:hypothetical protein
MAIGSICMQVDVGLIARVTNVDVKHFPEFLLRPLLRSGIGHKLHLADITPAFGLSTFELLHGR